MKNCVLSTTKGFTLVEVLVALLCISASCLLLVQSTLLLKSLMQTRYESEDRIALSQLRLLLAAGDTYQVQGNQFFFQYQGKERYLELHNHRLVRRSGYVIYLQDIDDVSFQQDGNCYQMSWYRDTIQKSAVIACE